MCFCLQLQQGNFFKMKQTAFRCLDISFILSEMAGTVYSLQIQDLVKSRSGLRDLAFNFRKPDL